MKITSGLTVLVLLMSILGCSAYRSAPAKAFAIVTGQSRKINGLIFVRETNFGIRLDGWITGLTPGKHGFHVHTSGDVSGDGCNSTGSHYNPRMAPHGSPKNEANRRHIGDLGNIVANQDGVAFVKITDHIITLSGTESILGRALVVHANEDDLTATANTGARLACGTISSFRRQNY